VGNVEHCHDLALDVNRVDDAILPATGAPSAVQGTSEPLTDPLWVRQERPSHEFHGCSGDTLGQLLGDGSRGAASYL
jgi:hypothetical protein